MLQAWIEHPACPPWGRSRGRPWGAAQAGERDVLAVLIGQCEVGGVRPLDLGHVTLSACADPRQLRPAGRRRSASDVALGWVDWPRSPIAVSSKSSSDVVAAITRDQHAVGPAASSVNLGVSRREAAACRATPSRPAASKRRADVGVPAGKPLRARPVSICGRAIGVLDVEGEEQLHKPASAWAVKQPGASDGSPPDRGG